MKVKNVSLRVFSVLAFATLIVACQTELTLETAPQSIAAAANPRGECEPYTAYWKADDWGEEDWGGQVEATNPPGNGAITLGLGDYPPTFTYSNNSDMDLVRIVVKAGQQASVNNNPGDSGSISWDAPPAISHVTFCFEEGDDATTTVAPTTTAGGDTTTSAGGDTSTTGGVTTTSSGETTITQGEVTTTAAGGSTTTQAGGATTTVPDGATTTVPDSGTTLPDAGATTTVADGQTTTTAEVGAGTLEPGQETSTTGEGGGTTDPGETTTTDGDDVEGGASESTLPYTGAGDMTTGGMAGLLVAAGIVLLVFARRKSDAE